MVFIKVTLTCATGRRPLLILFKVNDVFHTGSPDSTLWEFKHGNGSFKRGDLVGLRDIKRRASRHALIHRDSFPGSKSAGPSVPGTPNEQMGDSIENRMSVFEHTINDIAFRLNRTEETNAMLSNRCQTAIEGLTRCHQVSPRSKAFSTYLELSHSFSFLFTLCYLSCLFCRLLHSFPIPSSLFRCAARSYVYSGQLTYRNS
jgi:hypothetical protein